MANELKQPVKYHWKPNEKAGIFTVNYAEILASRNKFCSLPCKVRGKKSLPLQKDKVTDSIHA